MRKSISLLIAAAVAAVSLPAFAATAPKAAEDINAPVMTAEAPAVRHSKTVAKKPAHKKPAHKKAKAGKRAKHRPLRHTTR